MSTPFVVPTFSHTADSWHTINWKLANKSVRGLQIRIAKAAKYQKWRKVKTLQRMLVRSFAAKVIAVKRVTENRGKGTAGVDGKLWSTINYILLVIAVLEKMTIVRISLNSQSDIADGLCFLLLLNHCIEQCFYFGVFLIAR